jgi:TolB protein
MDQEQPTPEPEPLPEPAAEAQDAAATDEAAPSRSRSRLRIAVALTLVAAVALLAAIQAAGLVGILGGSSTATAPTRIAVVDAAGTLTTMDDRGGSLVPHPVDGVQFVFPAWSPDGTRIAAIGGATSDGGVYVFQARGEGSADPTAVTAPVALYRSPDRPPFYLYWTPDSRQVTFLTTEPEGLAMRVAPADGSASAAVVREGAPLYWDWIDNARAFVNVGAGGPGAFLGELGLDGVAGVSTAAAPGVFRSPVVTHDGTHRAFVIASGSSESIVIEPRDGANRHEIPVPGMAAIGFAPAGTSLAFIAPKAPGPPIGLPIGPLRVVDVASGAVRTLLDGSLVAFFWSPDGRTIATLRIPGPDDDELASLGVAVPAAVFPPTATSAGYALHLAFVDVASGNVRSSRDVRVSDLYGLQLLPFFDQYALSHRFWSPDSSSILLPLVRDDGVVGIVVLPADGSEERRIADGEMGTFSP